MTRFRRPLSAPVVLLLLGCASAPVADGTPAGPAMAPGVKGGIAWARPNGYVSYEAFWSDTRVSVGPRGGPTGGCGRQADGTWASGITALIVKGSRLTGARDQIDLTLTRLPDGFSVTGVYWMENGYLVVTSKGAQAQQLFATGLLPTHGGDGREDAIPEAERPQRRNAGAIHFSLADARVGRSVQFAGVTALVLPAESPPLGHFDRLSFNA